MSLRRIVITYEAAAYKRALAAADAQRENNHNGCGNLSERQLVAFCTFFLEVALNQIQ